MIRNATVGLVASLLVGTTTSAAVAAGRCARSCGAQLASCRASTCGGLQGAARRRCTEDCRARTGCSPGLRTLAYVVTRCRVLGGDIVGEQELQIRRRNCDPVTVVHFATPGPVSDQLGLCSRLGRNGEGFGSPLAGVIQRIGVAPDGSGVAFEISNQFELIGRTALAPEQQGFFYVRSDGAGLRRLTAPSQEPTYRIWIDSQGQPTANFLSHLSFSPSGRRVVYADLGPSPSGEETIQVFMLDVINGRRTQVTHLPAASPALPPGVRLTGNVFFLDEHTIQFRTYALEPAGLFTIDTDGTGLIPVPPPLTRAGLPTSTVVPVFEVTNPTGRDITLGLPGTPTNRRESNTTLPIAEVFRVPGKGLLLQLTNFGRVDTYGVADIDHGRRVLAVASTNRLGTNPFENCQLFSVEGLGRGLRQLTHFDEGVHSVNGCDFTSPPGCAFAEIFTDPVTNVVVFYSNCSLIGMNRRGSQIFVMRANGTGLRQLTHTAGVTTGPDGAVVEVEIPGPLAYSSSNRLPAAGQ